MKGTRTSWIQGIDINAQIDRLFCPHSVSDLLDDARGTNGINLSSFRDLKAAIAVVFVVAQT